MIVIEISRELFFGLIVEVISIFIVVLIKKNSNRVIALVIGTIISGYIGFSSQIKGFFNPDLDTTSSNFTITQSPTPKPTEIPVSATPENDFLELDTPMLGQTFLETECSVEEKSTITQKDLWLKDEVIFVSKYSMTDVNKNVSWQLTRPDGSLFENGEETLGANNECLFIYTSVTENDAVGVYKFELLYNGSVAYEKSFEIQSSDFSDITLSRRAIGDFTFGQGGVNLYYCATLGENLPTLIDFSKTPDDLWLYIASPYLESDIGKKITWSTYFPNGNLIYENTFILEDRKDLCFWTAHELLWFKYEDGLYRTTIKINEEEILTEDFEVITP